MPGPQESVAGSPCAVALAAEGKPGRWSLEPCRSLVNLEFTVLVTRKMGGHGRANCLDGQRIGVVGFPGVTRHVLQSLLLPQHGCEK